MQKAQHWLDTEAKIPYALPQVIQLHNNNSIDCIISFGLYTKAVAAKLGSANCLAFCSDAVLKLKMAARFGFLH